MCSSDRETYQHLANFHGSLSGYVVASEVITLIAHSFTGKKPWFVPLSHSFEPRDQHTEPRLPVNRSTCNGCPGRTTKLSVNSMTAKYHNSVGLYRYKSNYVYYVTSVSLAVIHDSKVKLAPTWISARALAQSLSARRGADLVGRTSRRNFI
jgi:hypothetical protein